MAPKNIVMKHRTHSISQRSRLVIFLLYIVGLFGASWLANGSIVPPLGTEGFWFYSTLPALLLVVLLVTPFFSRPVDSLSYAIATLIALLVADIWSRDTTTNLDRSIWLVALCFCVFVVLVTMLTILLYNHNYDQRSRLSKIFYKVSIVFGSPEVVYSIVFLFALVAFHRDSIREFIVFGIVWLVVVLALMERLWRYIMRIAKIQPKAEQAIYIGKIIAHNSPNIILIRVIPEQDVEFGDLILARNEQGKLGVAIALDYVGYSYGRWLRAYHFGISEDFQTSNISPESVLRSGAVYKLENTEISKAVVDQAEMLIKKYIGIVAQGTTINQVQIEVVRSDIDIKQGSVLELSIGNRIVDYQVLEGITKEEILAQKNTKGYVYVKARKVGCWSSEYNRYEAIPWFPNPNQIVQIKDIVSTHFNKKSVGHLPSTKNSIIVDVNKLVTHNSAILGVLGSGKTWLAIELAERMIVKGIKVVCIDSTGQYNNELQIYYNQMSDNNLVNSLARVGPDGKDNPQFNVQEGGSVVEFRQIVNQSLKHFLSPHNPERLRIIDPSNFEIWKQDGSMSWRYNDASMATLSYSEITQIISMQILEIVKSMGLYNTARCCIIFEEAHSLIPEFGSSVGYADKNAVAGTARAILQGRKFGFGCIVVTQRTASVTKSILSQCNTVFSLRVYDDTAMSFLENYFGKEYISLLPSLENRHAIVSGIASSSQMPVQIKLNNRSEFTRLFRANPDV